MVVKCEGGEVFSSLLNKSTLFSGLAFQGCEHHTCFSSSINFCPLVPIPFLGIRFLGYILEPLNPVDYMPPLPTLLPQVRLKDFRWLD